MLQVTQTLVGPFLLLSTPDFAMKASFLTFFEVYDIGTLLYISKLNICSLSSHFAIVQKFRDDNFRKL